MTVHVCRQLSIGPTGSYGNLYALGCFLSGVLNFKLTSSAGSAQGLLPYKLAYGNQASIYTTGSVTYVDIPFSDITGSLSVSASYGPTFPYPGYIIALRSPSHPLANSGLYTIISSTLPPGSSFPTTGTLNLALQFRTTSSAYVEQGLGWSLFNPINTATGVSSATTLIDNSPRNFGNGTTGYQTSGSSTSLRAIYVSPHSLAWQVRLCLESLGDRGVGFDAQGTCFSVAPGFSGTAGDFYPGVGLSAGAPHLHAPQWFNTTSSNYAGTVCGLDPCLVTSNMVTSLTASFWAWGDDSTGSCVFINSGSAPQVGLLAEGLCAFGLPEDEQNPLAPHPIQRLFVVGSSTSTGRLIDWSMGSQSSEAFTGMAMSWDLRLGPISCIMAGWSFLGGDFGSNSFNIRFDPLAIDTPFLQATELLPVDLYAGTHGNWSNPITTGDVLNIEPRRLGRAPFVRFGRANQIPFSQPVTGSGWIHLRNGVYMPWDPNIIPLNSGSLLQ